MIEPEVKIIVNEMGTLFAKFPTGEVRTILVDVHDTQHYGILLVGNVPKSEVPQDD